MTFIALFGGRDMQYKGLGTMERNKIAWIEYHRSHIGCDSLQDCKILNTIKEGMFSGWGPKERF